ncbi:putative amidase [Xylaria bambusicola]|uniref:putative amidase n=1 Tax=Xylaria bambusicola TaxID=326684 RepID=UPI0020086595|nr:putative amidase [Xylaria bambusicola]KAI0517468.1 putative amidase [Xylaria bambusicola]
MSLIQLESGPNRVVGDDLKPILKKAGLDLSESLVEDYSTLLTSFEAAIDSLPDDRKVQPRPDLDKYPRKDIHVPEDNESGAWATKVTARCTSPQSNLLEGRTVALKDNIALAGVRCTNGTAMVEWVPEVDATVATRIMDAGATITGKASCENACMEGISCTSVTGPVHNPYAKGYSAAGSSSGSGRLVATGAVDLALGCDQGGSIRMPASACGIVGLKPTWGLVPYTGILSLDATLDHVGPMAKTVRDCALLLEAIAGPDGWDDRQPPVELGGCQLKYVEDIDGVARLPKSNMLDGMKIGMLMEGFEVPGHDKNVSACVRSAALKLSELGATVSSVSVPMHAKGASTWMVSVPSLSPRAALLGERHGRKDLYFPDRCELVGDKLTQAQFDALGPGASYMYLAYLWAQERYGPKLHARCMNLLKAVGDAYDLALKDVDILITPTLSCPPLMGMTTGLLANTSPLNSTGHPALSLPVGFSPAIEDSNVKLPVGMQIIGRKFRDIDCLKVAAAWEATFDWKTLVFEGNS